MSQGNARGLSVIYSSPQVSAGTQMASTGTIVFSNSPTVTFGMSASSVITASAAGGGAAGSISAGTTRGTLGEVVFSNSNGLTFGLNGQTLTGSHNGLTSQSNQAFSASGGSSAFQTLNFANSNGFTFSNSNGSVIGSYTVPNTAGLLSAINVSAGTTSNNTSQISFANSNGVSFGLNAGTVTASHNALTSQSNQAFSASGGSSAFQTLNFANSNGFTFSNTNGSVVGSYTVPSTAGLLSAINVSAGTTSNNASAVVFSNGNNVSFGLNGSTVTGSASFNQTNQTVGVYGSSQTTGQSSSSTYDARSLTIRGAGIVSVGNSGGEIVISATGGGGADGGVGVSAGTTSASNGTVVFSNSNNVSFGLNGSTVTASASFAAQTVQPGIQSISAGTTRATTGEVVWSNSNGVSFGLNGQTVTASHNGLTSQSNQAFSASGGSSAFQTLNFANSNGLTFSNSNGSVIASYTVPTQSDQTIGFYAVSNTTGASSSSTVDARSLSFQGAGIASVGMTNGSVVVSVPAGGGGGDGVNILAAGTQTANTTGTVVFSNSNGVTFGMSDNSVITASVNAGGGGGATLSYFDPYPAAVWTRQQFINTGRPIIAPMAVPQYLQIDRAVHWASFTVSSSSNSSHAGALTLDVGIYSKNGDSLSLAVSGSQSWQWTNTSNQSTSVLSGLRCLTVPIETTLDPGNWWFAIMSRTTTSGANWWTASNLVMSNINTAMSGHFLSASTASFQSALGYGYGPSGTIMPGSMAFSDIIQGTQMMYRSQPVVSFVYSTV